MRIEPGWLDRVSPFSALAEIVTLCLARVFARLLDGLIEQGAGMLRRHLHLDDIGVDLGHLHGFADEQIEARRLFVDDLDHVAAAGLVQPFGFKQVVAAARMEVSGVRSSWVSESMSAVRRRSPSRAASMRAEVSMAMERATTMAT